MCSFDQHSHTFAVQVRSWDEKIMLRIDIFACGFKQLCIETAEDSCKS